MSQALKCVELGKGGWDVPRLRSFTGRSLRARRTMHEDMTTTLIAGIKQKKHARKCA